MNVARISALVVFVIACTLALATHAYAQLQYVPLASPCRAVDTRTINSPVQGGTTSVFNPATACNLPSKGQGQQATVYAMNVTVVPHTRLNYLTIWGTGSDQPTASTLNSYDGRVKANYALVASGAAGQVSVFASNTTDVILDVSGYFIPAPATGTAMLFTPVTPCRLLDTRNPAGPLGGPFLAANSVRTFPLAGSCSLPDLSSGGVLSVNVTAVPRGEPLGYLTVWGATTGANPQPAPSTLNSNTGTVVANAAFLTINPGTGTSISSIGNGDSDLIVDVNGYFTQNTSGMAYYPTATPERLLDTRLLSGAFVAERTMRVTTSPTVFVLNTTVVPDGDLGFLTIWPDGTTDGTPIPTVSTLNALDGYVTSNMAVVTTGVTGSIDVYADGATQLILDWSGSFMPRPQADPVVFIGDEISQGLVLAANNPTWQCYNCLSTTTSTIAVEELDQVIALKPRAVHILVGAHELSGPGTIGDPAETGNVPLGNIASMVAMLKLAKIPVTIGNMPPCTLINSYRFDLGLFAATSGFDPTAITGVPLIDYYDIGEASALCANGFDPNSQGYRLMVPLAQAGISSAESE
jgi:hypothetical protein